MDDDEDEDDDADDDDEGDDDQLEDISPHHSLHSSWEVKVWRTKLSENKKVCIVSVQKIYSELCEGRTKLWL